MKISMYELHKQYLRVLQRTNLVKLREMLETKKGRALEIGYVSETLEEIYKALKDEVRDKELTNEDFPLSVGTGGLKLTIVPEPLLMELSIDICDSQEYDDDYIPNCPFKKDKLEYIRDLFAESIVEFKDAKDAETQIEREIHLGIFNVCQRMLGCEQFKSLEEFDNCKSLSWNKVLGIDG